MKKPNIIGHIDLDKLDETKNVKDNRKSWSKLEKELVKSREVTSTCSMCGRTKYTSECPCEIDC